MTRSSSTTAPAWGGPFRDATLERIRAAVLEARGLDLSHYKEGFVLRRIAVRQRSLGLERLARYALRLQRDADEMEHLMRTLTVNVSEFFRNPPLFRTLERSVLPELAACAARRGTPLRVWSAGCATGEEAYSVAILLDRCAVPHGGVSVQGTDIDREAVSRARAGAFDLPRLREVEPDTLERYFEADPRPRTFRIRKDRIPPVRFAVGDVMGRSLQRDIDLLLCRNLLIYVDLDLQERLLSALADALRPGGILVLGRVERLVGETRAGFEALDARERVYRKRDPGAAHAS